MAQNHAKFLSISVRNSDSFANQPRLETHSTLNTVNTIPSIGEQLRNERERKGLSIEDIAHSTRIHADTVLNLEADDYSSFASTTYAKSFLKKYAAHLEVDASEALEQFASDATSPIVGGANYIRSVAGAIEPVERISGLRDSGNFAQVAAEPKQRTTPRNGGPPIMLSLFLVVLLAAIGVLIKIGHGAKTPEDAWSNFSETFGVGDTSDSAETKDSVTAAEVKNSPGTRIAPAAPLTRSVIPKPEPSGGHDLDDFVPGTAPFSKASAPLAQATSTESNTASITKSIRATPIAKPVVLPTADADPEENAEDGDDSAE